MSGKLCPFEPECQPSFGLKTVNTGHSILNSLTEGQLFQWLSGSKWKSRQMDSSSKKTNKSGQTWNPEKPRETKPSLHPVNSPLFFLLYFSPHILFCFGTNWKTSLDYDLIMEEAWYKRPTENIGMPKLVIKSISITSSIFGGGVGSKTSDSKQTFFLDSAFLSRLQSHKRVIDPLLQKGKLRLEKLGDL